VPATITTQGVWCLRHDLSTAITSGNAITIATNNVTIDCNDFKVGGLAAGAGTESRGIYASNRLNATVRHCNIRGFLFGLVFEGLGGGHVVEDNRFDSNTAAGAFIQGDGSVLRRNQVFDTGGSTAITGVANGIVAFDSVDVLDNVVSGVLPSADGSGAGIARGMFIANNPNGRINGNGVRGVVRVGTGVAHGIVNSAHGRISLRGNDVSGDGSAGSIGLSCISSNARAKDNIVNGFATPILTCRDDGNSL